MSDMQKNVTSGNRKGRPNYSPEFKQQLVAASCEPGVSISKLARENGINASLLFKWRQQWREGTLLLPSSDSPQLLPVTLDDRNAGSALAPAVWFAYSPDRKGLHPQGHLAGTFGDFLEQLLQLETNSRNERRRQTLLRLSGLPAVKTLEQFGFKFARELNLEPCTTAVSSPQSNGMARGS